MESGGAAIRNVGLITAALTALPVAIWRGIVADKQSASAQSQANAAQQSLRNERYQKGAKMLGSQVLAVRMGGIYALQRLSEEYPQEYHVQITRLFCAFLRYPTKDEEYEDEIKTSNTAPYVREDVATVIHAIGRRDHMRISIEKKAQYRLDLNAAKFFRLQMFEVNLSGSMCIAIELVDSSLYEADLSGATLSLALLKGTKFDDSNLSGTDLSEARGLTQAQLDQARADLDNPPHLKGALDAETGQPLVWTGGRGAPLKDES